MGSLRNAYLDVLGIDRWVSRSAPAEVAVVPEPIGGAGKEMPGIQRAPAPLAPAANPENPYPVPSSLPPSADWGELRQRVAGCTACAELCRTRT